MSAEEHPDETADSPLVVLTSVIRRLFQMLVAVAYQLGNALSAFNGEDSSDSLKYTESVTTPTTSSLGRPNSACPCLMTSVTQCFHGSLS
jgi:hypothetical protein